MGGRSVFLLSANKGDASRSLTVGLGKETLQMSDSHYILTQPSNFIIQSNDHKVNMQVSSRILTLRALTVSILCHLRLIPSSARKLLSQRNSQKAKADRESVFKASQSAGKNANVQRGKTAGVELKSFPMIPHLQSCPTDDLIYRPCKTGAGNQW